MVTSKKIKILSLLIVCFFGFFALNQDVHAYDHADIMKKWIFTLYNHCTKRGIITEEITPQANGRVADSVFAESIAKRSDYHLPSFNFGYWKGNEETTISCYDIFNGNDTVEVKGALDYYQNGAYKNTDWSDTEAANALLTGISYGFVQNDNQEGEMKFSVPVIRHNVRTNNNGTQTTFENADDGITKNIVITVTNNNGELSYSIDNRNQDWPGTHGINIEIIDGEEANKSVLHAYKAGSDDETQYANGSGDIKIDFNKNSIEDFRGALSNLRNREIIFFEENYTNLTASPYFRFKFNDYVDLSEGYYKYGGNGDRTLQTSIAITNMSGNNITGQNLTDSEKYTLYYHYLRYASSRTAETSISCNRDALSNGNYIENVKLKDSDGEFKECYVLFNDNPEGITVYVQSSASTDKQPNPAGFPFIVPASMQDIIDWFNTIDPSNLDDSIPTVGEVEDVADDEEHDLCYEAAGDMSWQLCSLMQNIANGASSLYEQIVEPFLVVEPVLLKTEGATWQAWSVMMGFANTLMVIYLLIVIFSQLTGIGINNYGIKKTLPKMIVAALLINLSFLICQLAVDLSNILGNSLNNMLTQIADNNVTAGLDRVSADISTNSGWFSALLGGATGGLVAIGGVSIATAFITGGGAALISSLLIPILMMLITVIISILFFFVLLGLRKAGVIIFVILSPLAFVCYMLPNTKQYFDKWYKIFSGLLLVYPICGVLIGGGYLVSKVLLSASEEFIMYFTGCILMVVPFFFIPKILKSSFTALGNLGMVLSGMGKKISGWGGRTLDNTIKNNPGYQEAVERGKEAANVRRANRIKEKLGNRNYEGLSRSQKRTLYNAQKTLISDKDIEGRAESMAIGYEAAKAGVQSKARDEDISNRLFLMQQNGIAGNAYTLENMDTRMGILAQKENLSSDEQLEMAALARGMVQEKGGAGKLAAIVRDKDNKGVSKSFMRSFGNIYANDSTVRSKMREKDAGASIYTEQFMQGGKEAEGASFSDFQGTQEYTKAMKSRVKSHEAGLSQSGDAFNEYLSGINSKEDLQDIMNNQDLLQRLDVNDRNKVVKKANDKGVYGPRAIDVNIVNGDAS